MAKFSGNIGFSVTSESIDEPGVYVNTITEKLYYGDVTRNYRQTENSGKYIDDFNINNIISIVANDYAMENIGNIKYVWWKGVKWNIKSVDVQHPRLILTLGGIFK